MERRVSHYHRICFLVACIAVSMDFGVSAGDREPIVLDISDNPQGRLPCSGVGVEGGFVLTAQHCVTGRTYVRQGKARFRHAEIAWLSQDRDIALLSSSGLAKPGLFRLAETQDTSRLSTADLRVLTRRGLTQARLASVEERFVRVIVPGDALCFGDSGTPLFVRRGGDLRVLGVLSVGARDCSPQGVNRFDRLDNAVGLPPTVRQ